MSRWWRAHDEAVDDPKLQQLPGDLFKAWFNLCCVTSQNDGTLPDIAAIAFKLRTTKHKAAAILTGLHNAGLLDKTETGFRPHNWDGRQYKSDDSNDRVAKYRAKRKEAGLPTLSDYGRFKPLLIERDGERCVYCEVPGPMVVDHMIPICLGGNDDIDNLALACKPCNSGKSGRTPELANMTIRVTSARDALSRYRDSNKNVTVTVTPPESDQIRSETEDNLSCQKTARKKANGWSPPKHGATSAKHGTVYVRKGTSEWAAYAEDHRKTLGSEPVADETGGKWFPVAGTQVALPELTRLRRNN